MVPIVEGRARLEDFHLGPAFRQQRLALARDGGVLQLPELRHVGEVGVLAEQVADRPALVILQREDGVGSRHRAAEQPVPEPFPDRGVAVLEQLHPRFLLFRRRQGKLPQRLRVDSIGAVEVADRFDQVAQREPLAHLARRQAEGLGDILDRLAQADQPHEGFILAHRIGIEPGDILDQRGFERGGIVAVRHDRAGQRLDLAALGDDDARSREPAGSRDDLGAVGEPFGRTSSGRRMPCLRMVGRMSVTSGSVP